jgi:uncharacterized protein (TIGR00299 family) protein
MTRLLYVDAFDGVSGDLLLGALLDVGASVQLVREAVAALGLPCELRLEHRTVRGIRATRAVVVDPQPVVARSYEEIRRVVARSSLPAAIRRRAASVLHRLAAAEARLHGVRIGQVHLHEVGGLDTVAEVVGVVAALKGLGVEEVASSTLPWSSGFVAAAHGELPLPAPAAVQCLPGAAWHPTTRQEELVTPTGAALLGTLCRHFGPPPGLVVERQGYGATERSLLRVVLGRRAEGRGEVWTVTVQVDDLWLESVPAVIASTLRAGALDVRAAAVLMKKGRLGLEFVAICRASDRERVTDTLLRETGSLGARLFPCERVELDRAHDVIEVDGHPVRVKAGPYGAKPEWDDVERLAGELGLTPRGALQRVLARLGARVSRETLSPPRPATRPRAADATPPPPETPA